MLKPTLIIEVPAELFVELFHWRLQLDGGLPHDGVDLLCFLESLVRSVDSVGLQRLFRQINAHLFLINSQNFHHFLLADFKELLNGLDTLGSDLGQHDEAFNIVVFD